MKIWYFTANSQNEFLVAYGETPEKAFEAFVNSRKELLKHNPDLGDINNWTVEEFTPNDYDGCLLFY